MGTLPLLPTFLDTPFDPSPYAPLSRHFWNEFYLDVQGSPEFESSAAAKSLWNSSELQRELKRLRKAPLVDYRRGMALKRKVLEAMAADFFKGMSGLQARSGRRQLGRLERNLAHRRWIGVRYDALLGPGLRA